MVKSGSPPPRLRRPPPLDTSSGERFKGVRRRSWGRWVSEIRIPHSRDKIWLGSYGSAEQAARAYDIASLLLRGSSCAAYLNFSDSTSLMDANQELAAFVTAGGIASPRTIQATAAAAANATTTGKRAGGNNGGDRCPKNQEEDIDDEEGGRNISQSSATSCTRDYTPQSQLCSYDHKRENTGGAQEIVCNSMSEPCWIQDVLSLIISPKDKTCSSPSAGALAPFVSCCASLQQRLSPSKAKCATASPPSIAIPSLHSSCASYSYGVQLSNKAASPEYLLQTLFDDFQHPLEGLARDGFTAISAAVTTRKRFDTETAGPSCDVDGTQLWSYVC